MHPEFGVWIQRQSYTLHDYYHEFQPHTKKVIGSFNSATVWDFGGLDYPTVVAVIDDGVTSHEDLPQSRILSGYDFADLDSDPTPGPEQAHGMACTGIIAASHSTDSLAGSEPSSGVISLNPHVIILPIKLYDDSGSSEGVFPSRVAEAITFAYNSGADILSNSWGYAFFCPNGFDVLSEALERAMLFGRNGRGCPVVFAAGNARSPLTLYPSCLDCCLAVGATKLDDMRWEYSSYGSALDLVAPSGLASLSGEVSGDVWTLDQLGSRGCNPRRMDDCPTLETNDINYYCKFGGTSAACPVVSGTAALLLSRDSTLRAQAVYCILRNSAVTHLDWGTITPPDFEFGYGRVDAFRSMLSIARGDMILDGEVTLGDMSILIDILFISLTPAFPDPLLADCNCDGAVDLADMTSMIDHLFVSLAPFPTPCFEFGDL